MVLGRAVVRELVDYAPWPGACGVGDCTCIVPTLGNLGETSGPRIDRIPPTRPPWWRRQFRALKKLIFSPSSKCPIDFFGPLANRTRLHATQRASCADYESGSDLHFPSLEFHSSAFPPSHRSSSPMVLLPRVLTTTTMRAPGG